MTVKLSPALEEILGASGVSLEPGKLHFAKKHRNCSSVAQFVAAVNYALMAKDKELLALHAANAKIAAEKSLESSRARAAAERCEKVTKIAISRGLEATDVAPMTRDRIMNVNGE